MLKTWIGSCREVAMAQLRINLDTETYQQLLNRALAERRPVPWHAEVMLRRALDLPFPYPAHPEKDKQADERNSLTSSVSTLGARP